MSLMSWLFGKDPEAEQENQQQDVVQIQKEMSPRVDSPKLIEEMDESLRARIATIVTTIRLNLTPANKTGHNSVMQTEIYTINFGTEGDKYYCKIVFDDREKDDSFTAQGDVDHDPHSADNIFMFHIHKDTKFTVEEGHTDINGTLHFKAVSHEKTQRMVAFIESSIANNDDQLNS